MWLSKEINRYVIGNNGLPEFSESGEFVAYGDYDALLKENERLSNELIEARRLFVRDTDELIAERGAAQKDAERYRWVARQLDAWSVLGEFYGLPSEHEGVEDLSEAIDQSIAEGY